MQLIHEHAHDQFVGIKPFGVLGSVEQAAGGAAAAAALGVGSDAVGARGTTCSAGRRLFEAAVDEAARGQLGAVRRAYRSVAASHRRNAAVGADQAIALGDGVGVGAVAKLGFERGAPAVWQRLEAMRCVAALRQQLLANGFTLAAMPRARWS